MPKPERNLQLLLELWQLQRPCEVVNHLRSIGGGLVTPAAQQELLACIRHPVTRQHEQPQYLRQLLKAVILAAEIADQELLDDLVDVQASFLLQPDEVHCYAAAADGDGCLLRRLDGCVTSPTFGRVTLHSSRNLLEGGTGCHADWEAGFLLAELVLSNPFLFTGRRCVELGCGAGLVGICLHRVGAGSVLLTDGDARTLSNCRRNLQENGVQVFADCQVQVRMLPWEQHRRLEADIILGADLLYDPGCFQDLVATLQATLCASAQRDSAGLPVAYLASTVRDEATLAAFLALLEPHQLHAALLQPGVDYACGTQFRHHAVLNSARGRVVVHRITPLPEE